VKVEREKNELVVPEFESREEEATFWDNLDTADYMEDDDEWFTFEWTVREDRCDRCGGGMDTRQIDLHLANGRVTLHNVAWYVCRTPHCGQTKLSPGIEQLAREIETSVKQALAQAKARQPSVEEGERIPA
jgi:hypothetical protein